MKAYELQAADDGWRSWFDLVRTSDGATVCTDACEPEDATFSRHFSDVVDELNRLAAENEKLREQRDERTRALQREVEQLRVQLESAKAAAAGQLSLPTSC